MELGKGVPLLTGAEGCVLTAVVAIMKSNLVQIAKNLRKIRLLIVAGIKEIFDGGIVLASDCSYQTFDRGRMKIVCALSDEMAVCYQPP